MCDLRFIVFGLVALASVGLGATSEWEEIGPHGADVAMLHTHPGNQDLVFAQSPDWGVFRSTDGGRTWGDCFVGGFAGSTSAFAVSPDNPDLMVVVGASAKIYRSNDGCASWNQLHDAPRPADGRHSLTIPPNRPRLILVAKGSLFRSDDGGLEWESAFSVSGVYFNMIIADPVRNGTWWLGGQRLYRSDDEGETWVEIPGVDGPRTMVFDPNDDEHILVSAGWTLLESTDGGLTFAVISTLGNYSFYRSLAIDPARPDRIWAVIATDGYSSDRLMRSDDAGATWNEVTHPSLTSANLNDVVVPSDSAGILVAQQLGIVASDDGGESWQSANAGLPGLTVGMGGILPLERDRKTILTSFPMHTEDGGRTWTRPSGDSDFAGVYSILMTADPADAATVYAVAHYTPTGLYRSTDAGASFTRITQLSLRGRLIIDPDDPTIWYMIGDDGPTRSVDGGQTLEQISSGLPDDRWIYDLFADPWNPGVLLALTSHNEIYRTENRGESWHHLYTLNDTTNYLHPDLTFDPTTPDRIYCALNGDFGSEVHVTTDGGQNWNLFAPDDPFEQNFRPHAIAPDPLVPKLVYGGAVDSYFDYQQNTYVEFSGVVISTDAGETWQPLNPAIEDDRLRSIWDLVVSPDGVYLYAPDGQHIFRLQLREPPPRRGGGRVEPD